MAKRTIAQLITKHEKDAAYWTAKSKEWARKAQAASDKAAALKAQVAEAHGA